MISPEGRMTEPEKITIIEGPPPTFEIVADGWVAGLAEGPVPSQVALCRLRTFNGASLVERCYRAWQAGQSAMLEYRTSDGLTHEAPILAARWLDIQDGQILLLWVRLDETEIEVEFEIDDDADEESDDPDSTLGQ
jgi:hypothetical protein